MKIDVFYTKRFVKQVSKFDTNLQKDIFASVKYFKDTKNHKQLEVHKLKNSMRMFHSFSVNYKMRIIFIFEKDKKSATLLQVGGHEIYK